MAADDRVTVFWSWQADSSARTNRSFIHDCLERASKALGRSDAILLEVDRDTSGVGGSPQIAETILAKIRSADVFVWDGTLVHSAPRPAPNPNVMIELGYALAVLGEGRLVGVMNTAEAGGPNDLPFDLRHRRWPITYSLAEHPTPRRLWRRKGDQDFTVRRATARDELVKDLQIAIRAALKEPKRGAINADVDLEASTRLWAIIDSNWLYNWHNSRGTVPQYERASALRRFEDYSHQARFPENTLRNAELRAIHEALLAAIEHYLMTTAIEMVPAKGSDEALVISVKASGLWIADYDSIYDRQVHTIREAIDRVWNTWQEYIQLLRTRYPSVIARPAA